MKFDRNTVIGFVLLALLFLGMFWFNSKEQNRYLAEKHKTDEIKRIQDSTKRATDSIARFQQLDTLKTPVQVVHTAADSAGFQQALQGTEATTTAENDLIKVVFTNKGGQPKLVELKKFKGPDSSDVKLGATDFDRINYTIAAAQNKTVAVDSLYFSAPEKATAADGSTTVTYRARSAEGKEIVHQFVIHPNNYMVDFTISIDGAQQVIGGNTLNLTWQANAVQQQKDISYERGQSKIGYRFEGNFDNHTAIGGGSKEFKSTVNWVAVKQQFFNYTLLAKNGFSSGNLIWSAPTDSSNIVAQATANMQLPLQNNKAELAFYYGPNDYTTLKQYHNDMEDMVDLGSGMFAFVKYINRFIILPAFNFFSKFTPNYGIAILLLTLLIRLIISPLTYSSYLSGAKMKVLRPEIEQLKVKTGGDQQAMSMEQMKLFREAGVNPLGGCIPALFQVPIFFALYSFFNSNVALRGQGFLWANDLSQYDSIFHIPFSIPLYGDHVSLFTITAVLTSFLISLYSMSMTPDQGNPVMKYMPYFFPFILLFVFNKLPAGLTWYYTVSNLITLGLQFVIQTYIIDHDKILAKMEANRKKPKTKSKWAERMEQMQEQQKQVQQQRKK
ncbi:membrane protein insertase YidC [Flavisolibacter ginsenosidimutans]|uniref:Membrane protein insertase YidC n=1 Tax=Flavisolibacter ginsenosidimutans TaxID=661481 RepID=A0A5B8UGY4_9BACT|nr:membrane protein insertase YidC [Flavisolibacter ginsenosidimutans]QEC55884.1 membrane protein insertase YidC [Flavisolibacter ginsenosidimutans]